MLITRNIFSEALYKSLVVCCIIKCSTLYKYKRRYLI